MGRSSAVQAQKVRHCLHPEAAAAHGVLHGGGYLLQRMSAGQLQDVEILEGGGPVRQAGPESSQVLGEDGRMPPRLQGLGMVQGTGPLPQQGQVVQRVQDVLLPTIATGVGGHHLGAVGDLHPVDKGAEKEPALAHGSGHAVAVGLEGDQAQAIRDDRHGAAARESPVRERQQVGTLLLPQLPDGCSLAAEAPPSLSQAAIPQEGVQLLKGADLGDGH